MKEPTGCVLWKEPGRVLSGTTEDGFETLATFVDESHWHRSLLKCRECGQLYFFEFYEEIDWVGGNDPQYCTYIPVDTDEDIASLKKTDRWGILAFAPRLQKDWPRDAEEPKVYWVGKKE